MTYCKTTTVQSTILSVFVWLAYFPEISPDMLGSPNISQKKNFCGSMERDFTSRATAMRFTEPTA